MISLLPTHMCQAKARLVHMQRRTNHRSVSQRVNELPRLDECEVQARNANSKKRKGGMARDHLVLYLGRRAFG